MLPLLGATITVAGSWFTEHAHALALSHAHICIGVVIIGMHTIGTKRVGDIHVQLSSLHDRIKLANATFEAGIATIIAHVHDHRIL
ncbi:MAG: hypothetical protein ACTHJ4_04585 [Candidatus Nucleicultricaceae bacterium]